MVKNVLKSQNLESYKITQPCDYNIYFYDMYLFAIIVQFILSIVLK